MKLNYRDKIILGALLAFVILLAGFFLLIKPKYTSIKNDSASLEKVQQEKDEVDAKIAEIKPLKEEIKKTYDETTELTDDFVAYNDILNPRKVDQYMQHFAEDVEIKVTQLSASDLSSKGLDYYYFKHKIIGEDMLKKADINGDLMNAMNESQAEEKALSSRSKESVLVATYSIKATGEKEKIWDYLKAIEEQDKTIIVDSVSLTNVIISEEAAKELEESSGDDKKESSAQITVSLYSVYDLSEPNLEAD